MITAWPSSNKRPRLTSRFKTICHFLLLCHLLEYECMQNPISPSVRSAIQTILAGYPQVVAVYLYGSHGRGTANTLSDIDIAVMLAKPSDATGDFHLDIIGEMMRIFHTDQVDVQLLTIDTPPALAFRMIQGKVLYCRSLKTKALIEAQVLSRYQDFQPFLTSQFSAMEQRIKEGHYASGH